MTAVAGAPERATSGPGRALARAFGREPWIVGLIVLLISLFVLTRVIQPNYGAAQVQNLAISVLPIALAAVAQAIVVISGGIDLSVGSVMALTSVTAAMLMEDASPELSVGIALGVLLLGLLIGAINGTLVVLSRVPDIIVTLAMLYVWAGAALLVLGTPGGGSAEWLSDLTSGSVLTEWLPKSFVLLVVLVALVWVPLRRSRFGLSLYAVGSDRLAAFRSGVDVSRTKVAAYALTGLFAAMGGLALTATTGIGTPIPGPYTLSSVAAIVLGGVSLVGGRGGVLGPIIAVYILALIRTDLTFMGVDPNVSTVVQGAILVGVVMVGAYLTLRRRRT
jgi:ribose transport system permease protein